MTLHALRRDLLHHLAKTPFLYSWVLKTTGRGSVEKRHYLRLIRRGDVVFDVGANLGTFTLLFSDLVGLHGSVHSFEPVPPTLALLNEAIRLDGRYRNIFVNAVACSEAPGTTEIIVPGGDYGQASLRAHSSGSWATSANVVRFSVSTIRLDDYAAERHLNQLDFIKCDAEGAELFVLKGATGLLKEFEPLLHLEVGEGWTRDFGYGPSDLVDFLEKVGYSYFLIEEEPARLEDLRGLLKKGACAGSVNLLCACPSHADRLRGL
jgi:FkbM family methyltransferase